MRKKLKKKNKSLKKQMRKLDKKLELVDASFSDKVDELSLAQRRLKYYNKPNPFRT